MANTIKDQAARIHVIACKALNPIGVTGQGTLVHLPGNAATTTASLWMVPLSKDTTYGTMSAGLKGSTVAEAFEFAIQTGFDGAEGSLAIGDTITFNSIDYDVEEIQVDQSGAIFTVKTTAPTVRVI